MTSQPETQFTMNLAASTSDSLRAPSSHIIAWRYQFPKYTIRCAHGFVHAELTDGLPIEYVHIVASEP